MRGATSNVQRPQRCAESEDGPGEDARFLAQRDGVGQAEGHLSQQSQAQPGGEGGGSSQGPSPIPISGGGRTSPDLGHHPPEGQQQPGEGCQPRQSQVQPGLEEEVVGVGRIAPGGDEEGGVAGVDHGEQCVETDAGEGMITDDAQRASPDLDPPDPTGLFGQRFQVGDTEERLAHPVGAVIDEQPDPHQQQDEDDPARPPAQRRAGQEQRQAHGDVGHTGLGQQQGEGGQSQGRRQAQRQQDVEQDGRRAAAKSVEQQNGGEGDEQRQRAGDLVGVEPALRPGDAPQQRGHALVDGGQKREQQGRLAAGPVRADQARRRHRRAARQDQRRRQPQAAPRADAVDHGVEQRHAQQKAAHLGQTAGRVVGGRQPDERHDQQNEQRNVQRRANRQAPLRHPAAGPQQRDQPQ